MVDGPMIVVLLPRDSHVNRVITQVKRPTKRSISTMSEQQPLLPSSNTNSTDGASRAKLRRFLDSRGLHQIIVTLVWLNLTTSISQQK